MTSEEMERLRQYATGMHATAGRLRVSAEIATAKAVVLEGYASELDSLIDEMEMACE